MKIKTQEISGIMQRPEGSVLFFYDSIKQRLTLELPKGIDWDTLQTWLEVLDEDPEPQAVPVTRPVTRAGTKYTDRTPRWARSCEAAKHYRVSMSTIHQWGLTGRIRRTRSGLTHARTKGPMWRYDVAHPYTAVPPKGTHVVTP